MSLKDRSNEIDLYIKTFMEFRTKEIQIIDRTRKLDQQCNEFHELLRTRRKNLKEQEQEILIHEQEMLDLRKANENLDVEIIRAKSLLKKTESYINKMQTMNASKIKVDADDADKGKVLKVQLRLKIMKSLLQCHINRDMTGFFLVSGENSLKPLNITTTISREMIRNIFWDNCKSATTQNSDIAEQWNSLFS